MDDELYVWCEICGKHDAMYIGEGDFLCDSTGQVYNAW